MDWQKIVLAIIAMISGSYGVITGFINYKKDVNKGRNQRDQIAWETMEKQYRNLEKSYDDLSKKVSQLEKKLDEFRDENTAKDKIILEKDRIIMKKDGEIEDLKEEVSDLKKTNKALRVKMAEMGGVKT